METRSHRALESNHLFAGLSPEQLERAMAIPEMITFEPEEVIFEEGSPGYHLYLVAEGSVRISKLGRGGKQETLAFLEPGDFFGEMAVYDPAPRSARAVALPGTCLGRMDRSGLEQLLHLAPLALSENLTRGAIRRLRLTNSHLIHEVLEAERLSLIGSMASSIIHDLKNPVSTVLGAAALLEEPLDPTRLPWLAGVLRRSVDRMQELIQDILDYSRGAVNLQIEPMLVDDLLRDLRAEILDSLHDRGYRVHQKVSYHGTVELDWTRFRRVLLNVLRNAAESMPDGGDITISIDAVDGTIEICIRDTGCGIPSEILPTIFEPFVTHGKASGTGLGMAIAKAIVEAHHGTIAVRSEPGKGSCFTIVVPHTSHANADTARAAPGPESGK